MDLRPWTSGPKELLEHAVGHLNQGTSFDSRIAMISIDNAVELAIKTYLGLPKRVRGTEGPSRRLFLEKSGGFPDLLDLLEQFAVDQLDGVSLGDIEGYHRLRNALYHDGNGVTVDPVHVDSYLQIARILLRNLLGISIDEAGTTPAHSILGQLVLSWGELEQTLRRLARAYLPKPKHEHGPVMGIVDGLVSKGALTGAFRSRLNAVAEARNQFVHGVSVPSDAELRPVVSEIEKLLAIVHDMEPHADALDTANSFLSAWVARDFEAGIRSMSNSLVNRHSGDGQEEHQSWLRLYMIGLSNPHHERFEIGHGKQLGVTRFAFPVKLYEAYTGERDDFTYDGIIELVRQGDQWRVDRLPRSSHNPDNTPANKPTETGAKSRRGLSAKRNAV